MCRQIIIYCVRSKCARECRDSRYKNRLFSEAPPAHTAQCVVINFLANIWCIHYISMFLAGVNSIFLILDLYSGDRAWACFHFPTIDMCIVFCVDSGLWVVYVEFCGHRLIRIFLVESERETSQEADKEHERRHEWVFTAMCECLVFMAFSWPADNLSSVDLLLLLLGNGKQTIESCHGERE